MSVKIGTTISGTYKDGPGLTHQSHLIYAANAGVWWIFTVTSAADTAGNPGTHTIKCMYSSSADLTTATWTAGTDAPNFDGSGTNTNATLEGGRNLACLYINNAAGSNKDIVLVTAEMQYINKLTGGNSYNGLIRAVVTATTITWDSWGGWVTAAWNNLASHVFQSGDALARTGDGYIVIAGAYLHSEVDAAALISVDPDTADTWTVGNISATGTDANASALITVMSNQTRLKANMGLSIENADWNVNRYPKVQTIDSPTQVTMQSTATGGGSTSLRWWQFTGGTNRNVTGAPVIDNTMTNECTCYAFAPLGLNRMLIVYDSGNDTPPNFNELNYQESTQSPVQGYWRGPPIDNGAGGNAKTVFGSTVSNEIQDWCLIGVDLFHIYCFRRSANTTIAGRAYNNGVWAAMPNQPPALTGKVIKVGGGVMGITDGVDLWLFVIDSTDNAIKYVKFTVATEAWGAWTLLETVDSTAKYLSGQPKRAGAQAGLIWAVTNGASFDTYTTSLSLPAAGAVGVGLPLVRPT